MRNHNADNRFGRHSCMGSGYMSWLLMLGGWLMLAVLPVQAEPALLAMDGQKIVTASSVRVRAEPTLEADVLGRVGLGAVVRGIRRTRDKLQIGELHDYWYQVESGELQGWVSGRYLRDFQPENREQIWFELIKERLDNPELSFPESVALYRFARLVNAHVQEGKLKGAFELGELLALQKSFDRLDISLAEQAPYAAWISEHQEAGRVFHDEISGQWLVPSTDYWKLADRYDGKAGADDIAWYAANAQLGGECEGDISCNLGREKITFGEYLKRHPYGRYAGASLQRISETLSYILQALEQQPDYFQQVTDTGPVIDELVELVANSNPKLSERAKAFGQIKAIQQAARL
ncbi:MAG: SH3 domain-containing protein [Thiolinea sp.]